MQNLTNKYYDNLTFAKLLAAYKRASLNKGTKSEIIIFSADLEINLIKLMNDLESFKYHIGKYFKFTIYEPKKRLIKRLPFRDRIVHQWYVEEFIKPYFIPRFIYDSYACIEDKGTHKAVKRVQCFMRKMYHSNNNYYILKMDVHHFFASIDRGILFEIMKNVIVDDNLLRFTYKMIFDNSDINGLCIGSYTSQYFANIYLNELDKYVKFNLKLKYYVRYMDDFIILVDNKEIAKFVFSSIMQFLKNRLNLELNPKSDYFPNRKGVDFYGFKIYETHKIVRRRSIKKMKKKIKECKYSNTDISIYYQSFYAHCKHGNYYNIMKVIDKMIE